MNKYCQRIDTDMLLEKLDGRSIDRFVRERSAGKRKFCPRGGGVISWIFRFIDFVRSRRVASFPTIGSTEFLGPRPRRVKKGQAAKSSEEIRG